MSSLCFSSNFTSFPEFFASVTLRSFNLLGATRARCEETSNNDTAISRGLFSIRPFVAFAYFAPTCSARISSGGSEGNANKRVICPSGKPSYTIIHTASFLRTEAPGSDGSARSSIGLWFAHLRPTQRSIMRKLRRAEERIVRAPYRRAWCQYIHVHSFGRAGHGAGVDKR